jgi:phosphoglycolate phosphatase
MSLRYLVRQSRQNDDLRLYIAVPYNGIGMNSYPALIFDLDGTLVDTAPDLLGALNGVLRDEGRPTVNVADLRHLVGHGARAMLGEAMRLTGEPEAEPRLAALVDAFIAHYRAHIADESRAFPGVEQTLGGFARDGAAMGVLTNKPQELTDLLLPALKLERYFGAVYGAGRLPFMKPDPRIFRAIVDDLGGGRAVMIGDSATDVATARAAGVPVILLSYGYTPEPAHTLGADAVTDDFAELPALIRRLAS